MISYGRCLDGLFLRVVSSFSCVTADHELGCAVVDVEPTVAVRAPVQGLKPRSVNLPSIAVEIVGSSEHWVKSCDTTQPKALATDQCNARRPPGDASAERSRTLSPSVTPIATENVRS